MNCKDTMEEIIARSGHDSLPEQVLRHLAGCPQCARSYREQQAIWRAMDAWELPPISSGFDQRLFARIGRRSSAPLAAWLGRVFPPLQPAFPLALACMLLVATFVVRSARQVNLSSGMSAGAQSIEQREDEKQIDLALDDMQMLNDLEILPVGQNTEGKS